MPRYSVDVAFSDMKLDSGGFTVKREHIDTKETRRLNR